MPSASSDQAVSTEDPAFNDIPSSTDNTDVKLPSEPANHETEQSQVVPDHSPSSNAVNLADVDHVQTVVTVQRPTASYDYLSLIHI